MELVPLSKKFATFSIHKSVLHLSVKKLEKKFKKIVKKLEEEKRNINHDKIIGLEGSNWEEINGCHFNE